MVLAQDIERKPTVIDGVDAIVRGLVARNAGHVHLEDTHGGGATSVLRLRRA